MELQEFNSYDFGDLVYVKGEFTDKDTGDPLDPTTISITVRSPSGVITTYLYLTDSEVVRDSTGIYHAAIDATESGMWYYRWWSTGSGQASDEQRYEVLEALAVEP